MFCNQNKGMQDTYRTISRLSLCENGTNDIVANWFSSGRRSLCQIVWEIEDVEEVCHATLSRTRGGLLP